MNNYTSDIAFTPAVKTIQTKKGSRSGYAKMEERSGWQTTVTPELTAFLSELDMFYLGTANAEAVHPIPGRSFTWETHALIDFGTGNSLR